MKCPRCAATLEDGARFCGVCGHRLEAAPEPRAQTTSPEKPRPGKARPDRPKAERKEKVSKIAIAPAAPPAGDPYIGTTLNGRFAVEGKLGEGGFGAVYNGTQLQTGRKVAIKLLHPEMTRDQNVVARFRREGQVLCSLRDAHTITTYDFDQTADGTLFIAMELLEGRSLHDIFHDEAPIAWQRMLKIMSEMCSSLEEAHSLGIVHRDLKPENIYLEARPGNPEFVKILDFGIAKVMRGDGSSGIAGDLSPQLTATGQTLGTLEYMSPEQLMGKALDGRSDIYGLGVVAFEMLTGRLPFPDAVGPAALISAQLKKTPPTASKIYPRGAIPPAVDQLILRMLAKDKGQRFRDVTELRREIDAILSSEAPAARPSSARPASSGSTPPAPDERKARSPSEPPTGRPGPGPGSGAAPAGPRRAHAPSPSVSAASTLIGGSAPPVRMPPHSSAPPSAVTARSGPRGAPAGRPLASPPGGLGGGPARRAPVAGPSLGPRPGLAPDDSDPPWAGGARPAGSSVSPGSMAPRATGVPAGAAEPPVPGRHTRSGVSSAPAPWMWIAVIAILVLAVVIGAALALR